MCPQALCAVPRTAVNYAGVAGGVTALYIACELGHADVVKALLSGVKPAVVTTANKFGALPIHAAAEAGHDAVVRVRLFASCNLMLCMCPCVLVCVVTGRVLCVRVS